VPLYCPDVKDDLAESLQLNQSHAASCVTLRCHGYLAATATRVNVPCHTMMDELVWGGKKGRKTYKQKFSQT